MNRLCISAVVIASLGACSEDVEVGSQAPEEVDGCDGVQVLRLAGQVLDIDGAVPAQPNYTLCAGACVRGQLEDDGTFELETDFCFLRNPPLTRPVFIYHGVGEYTDLYVDFVPPEADVLEEHVFAKPIRVVSRDDMVLTTIAEGQAGVLDDGKGFVLRFDSAAPPFGRDKIGVRRLIKEEWPDLPGIGSLTALYATLPEGVHFDVPAAVEFPNSEGLEPGSFVEIVAIGTIDTPNVFGGTVGPVATGVVTDDGASIVLVEGEGLDALTWVGYRPRVGGCCG